jgi:dTDP-4-amino-4,6-dideoxygalactose transaminase
VYHLFVVETGQRESLRVALAADGIETGIHYPIPLHRQPALEGLGYLAGAFPRAEQLASSSLSLPMYPELPMVHLQRVADRIARHLAN